MDKNNITNIYNIAKSVLGDLKGSQTPKEINLITLVMSAIHILVYWGLKLKKRVQSNESKIESLQRRMSRLTRSDP